MELAWKVAARVTSNTIVLARDGQAVGIGAGQQNRLDSARIAAERSAGRATGGACAQHGKINFQHMPSCQPRTAGRGARLTKDEWLGGW